MAVLTPRHKDLKSRYSDLVVPASPVMIPNKCCPDQIDRATSCASGRFSSSAPDRRGRSLERNLQRPVSTGRVARVGLKHVVPGLIAGPRKDQAAKICHDPVGSVVPRLPGELTALVTRVDGEVVQHHIAVGKPYGIDDVEPSEVRVLHLGGEREMLGPFGSGKQAV